MKSVLVRRYTGTNRILFTMADKIAMIWMNVKSVLVRRYTGTNRILFTIADKM